ncbi:hypothetical protein JOC78_000334 [Bacillus ectoiniformans]|uniref:F510_1955 family glycosylhydrolase n=1 Tax=Bacillus ectoiniformans TaxID=1494429 RepID=UPI00195AE10A|nr:hypothetical protein [Bacillus ectoiniformans]MBM7647413.1 hypothetical protein [Bacillus ectoiniformans]
MKKVSFIIGASCLALGLASCGNDEKQPPAEEKVKTEENAQTEKNSKESQKPSENQTVTIANDDFFQPFSGKMEHIHGMGYAGNEDALFFASHHGLKVYEDGKWLETKEQKHDYMGFAPVNDGFYTSGHPEEGSSLPNPFGIKRSVNNGRTLETLTLEGETDFHVMGVGYNQHTIYVLNPNKNSEMEAGALYFSEDDAKTWTQAEAEGLGNEISMMAVHPDNPEVAAAAGKDGIYLTEDKGKTFTLLTKGGQGTSVFFTSESLWYGSYDSKPGLIKRSLTDGTEKRIDLPVMDQDAVMYLAVNPNNEEEIAFTSFNGNVYLTNDGAKSWDMITEKGSIK